jgi:hypothetical protein
MVDCQEHDAGLRLSVSYMRQDDSYLSITRGRLTVISQLHDGGW